MLRHRVVIPPTLSTLRVRLSCSRSFKLINPCFGTHLSLPTNEAPKTKILVVDDQNDSADLLTSLLPLVYECTAYAAYSGAEALDLADLVCPQVVILDITMPGMDGCETARLMRERPWGRRASIITLSGWGDDEHCCAQTTIDFHLSKPVTIDALLWVLAKGRASLS